MFKRMLNEGSDPIGLMHENDYRDEYPSHSDRQVAEGTTGRFDGNRDFLDRSLWVKVRDSRLVSFLLVVAPTVLGTVLLSRSVSPEDLSFLGFFVVVAGATVSVGASFLVSVWRERARARRMMSLSSTGESLYRTILRHAARYEKATIDKLLTPEVVSIVGAFQRLAAQECEVADAAARVVLRSPNDRAYLSASMVADEASYLPSERKAEFDVLEARRSQVVDEMVRLIDVVARLADAAEADRAELEAVEQVFEEAAVEEWAPPVVDTSYVDAYLGARTLAEPDKVSTARLRE